MEEASKGADLVIEAIAEIRDEKIAFYEKLAKYLPQKTIIASNTSTFVPSTFAEFTGRPEKYLCLHFENQIWKNNIVEIMGHPGTGKKYYDEVVKFAEDINMIPLLVKKEQPGYIVNSLLVPFLKAATQLWANGVADPKTIDKAWMLATGFPVGPFRIIDIVGLKTFYNISSMQPEAKNPDSTQSKVLKLIKNKIDKGELGVESKKGFYEY